MRSLLQGILQRLRGPFIGLRGQGMLRRGKFSIRLLVMVWLGRRIYFGWLLREVRCGARI